MTFRFDSDGRSPKQTVSTIAKSAAPLVVSLLLQYSTTGVAILLVGSLGKIELAAVSLACTTANITGHAVFQGLATSLDTLCTQAYGAGELRDVGLHVQRMVLFQTLSMVLVAAVWLNSYNILLAFVPDPEVVLLASTYLKILLIGAPGWAFFECAKRFLQAQGLFTAATYVLLVLAPLNIALHWLLMFGCGLGFIGSAISVATTNLLLPVGASVYVYFFAGSECWCPLSGRIWQDWWPMVKMSFYGFIVVEAEWLAFEILTLASGRLGRDQLAVQGMLITIGTYSSQINIALATAAAMLAGQLYGAGFLEQTRSTIRLSLLMALVEGIIVCVMILAINPIISRATSEDERMFSLMLRSIPVIAGFSILDALAQVTCALMRSIGRQNLSSWISFPSYFVIGMPISFVLTFKFHGDLYGLWTGPGIASIIICVLQCWFLYNVKLETPTIAKRDRESEPLLQAAEAIMGEESRNRAV